LFDHAKRLFGGANHANDKPSEQSTSLLRVAGLGGDDTWRRRWSSKKATDRAQKCLFGCGELGTVIAARE
jgi:hypothetical protein